MDVRWLRCLLCLALAAVGVFCVSWWWVGDLSYPYSLDGTPAPPGVERTYVLRPPQLSIGQERGFAALGCGLVVAAGLALAVTLPARALLRWSTLLAAAALAGLLLGFAARTVTAGGYDANIGAGLVVLVGGPVLLALTAAIVVLALRWRRDLVGQTRTPRRPRLPGAS